MKKSWFILLTLFALLSPPAAHCAGPAPFSVVVSGSGSPMILIPGLASGGNVWDGTVEHFKSHYQCHVLTLAGFAGQPPIDGPFLGKVRDGIVSYIHDQKLDHPIIIGHSLGGMMAFWVAETAPNDVGPIVAVDGLPFYAAIMNPVASAESIAPMADGMRSSYADMSADKYIAANHRFLSAMITAPENVDKVASLGDKSNPKAVGQAFYDLMTTDLRPNLKSIQAPVLLIGASAATVDEATRTRMREGYAAQIESVPHHKLVFAPNARHFIQLDDPAFFYGQVEEFLKANSK
jgi:pimeloyl-ACP methyl ester carboxylesterase